MNRSIRALAGIAAAVALAGCTTPASPAPTSPTTASPVATTPTSPQEPPVAPSPIPAELVGTWRSTGTTGPRTLVEGSAVTLNIRPEADQFGLRTGCNTHTGQLGVTGDQLRTGRLGSTRTACEPKLMEQEAWVLDLFTKGSTWQLVDGGITLEVRGGDQTIRFGQIPQKS
ncbi:META domain-containing protein [Mariniluteicoccus endophyticus]